MLVCDHRYKDLAGSLRHSDLFHQTISHVFQGFIMFFRFRFISLEKKGKYRSWSADDVHGQYGHPDGFSRGQD